MELNQNFRRFDPDSAGFSGICAPANGPDRAQLFQPIPRLHFELVPLGTIRLLRVLRRFRATFNRRFGATRKSRKVGIWRKRGDFDRTPHRGPYSYSQPHNRGRFVLEK